MTKDVTKKVIHKGEESALKDALSAELNGDYAISVTTLSSDEKRVEVTALNGDPLTEDELVNIEDAFASYQAY
jgi:hypothetical protein